MTKNETKKTVKTVEADLGNGMHVIMRQGNGHDVIKARTAANHGETTTFFLIAELSTFDGKRIPAEEILDFDMPDVFKLEELWGELVKMKQLQA